MREIFAGSNMHINRCAIQIRNQIIIITMKNFATVCILASTAVAEIVSNAYWSDSHTFNDTSGKNLKFEAGVALGQDATTN